MELPDSVLKKRQRVTLDIAQYVPKEEVSKTEDVSSWHSTKRNIGPLKENWFNDPQYPQIMWCYKNVTITCRYLGLQSIVENLIRKQQQMIFTRSMRQMIVQMDEWDGMTLDDIRKLEDETKRKLDELIKSSELSEE